MLSVTKMHYFSELIRGMHQTNHSRDKDNDDDDEVNDATEILSEESCARASVVCT